MKWINTPCEHMRSALNPVRWLGTLPDAHALQEDINDCTSPMSHQPETVQAISLINKRATESACWVDYSSPRSFRPYDSWILKVLANVWYWYRLFVWHEKMLDEYLFCIQSSSQYNCSGAVSVQLHMGELHGSHFKYSIKKSLFEKKKVK